LSHGFPTFQVGARNIVLVDALTRRIPAVSDRPTIVFGVDVTLPHPGEDSSPSIAVVSAALAGGKIDQYFCYSVVKVFFFCSLEHAELCVILFSLKIKTFQH
jgi:hypothetical protein